VVHLCYDVATKAKSAVKILPRLRAKQAPERTARKLAREVALQRRVAAESAGVTELRDVFQDAKYVYLVMALNEGGDLEALLEVRAWSWLFSGSALSRAVGRDRQHLHASLPLPSPCWQLGYIVAAVLLIQEWLRKGWGGAAAARRILGARRGGGDARVPEDHLRVPRQRCASTRSEEFLLPAFGQPTHSMHAAAPLPC
jgi:hypothetical protein